MDKVTLQFSIDISLAKYLIALYSCLAGPWGEDRFDDMLANDDIPAALRLIADKLYNADSIQNLQWSADDREFINRIIKLDKFKLET